MFTRLELSNYKCFSAKKKVLFSVPDGESVGSGLNIFIGENNSGKTAVISAFTKLKGDASIHKDEKHKGEDVELVFTDNNGKRRIIKNMSGGSNIDPDSSLINPDFKLSFEKDIDYIKDNRIWTSNSGPGDTPASVYRRGISIRRQDIDGRLASALSTLEIRNPDKKEELNAYLKKIIPSFSNWTIDSDSRSGKFVTYEMLSGDSQDIEFSIGSGILNLFRIIFGLVDETSKILIIDEPEAYLHPIAQIKLADIALEKSKDKQIIMATHSPYMFKNLLPRGVLLTIFRRSKGGNISISRVKDRLNLFDDLSPTFNEINFYAYGLITPDFHNELYGFAQYACGKQDSIKKFDTFLVRKGDKKKSSSYKQKNYQGLTTYIRNYIHHPEQASGKKKYSDSDLKWSVNFLIKLIKSLS